MKIGDRINQYLKKYDEIKTWNEKYPSKLPLPSIQDVIIKPIIKAVASQTKSQFKRVIPKGIAHCLVFKTKTGEEFSLDIEIKIEERLIYLLLDESTHLKYSRNTIGDLIGLNRRKITYQSHWDEKSLANHITKNLKYFTK